jgi:hypothetical protein
MRKVIDVIKKSVAAHNMGKTHEDTVVIKREVIGQLKGLKGWHWTFFNIFAYDKIINEVSDAELNKLYIGNQLEDDMVKIFNDSKGVKEMKSIFKTLLGELSLMKFYYSIPIKPPETPGGALLANSYIAGKEGFSTETFGDKFFINISPESGRILMD